MGKKVKKDNNLISYSVNNITGFELQECQWEGASYTTANKDGYKTVKYNELAYNPARINIGSIGLFKEDEGKISSLYVVFSCTKNIYPDYMYEYMKSSIFHKQILARQEGGVRSYFFYENFAGVTINYPSLKEQKKIVDFINLLNKKIRLISSKLESLKKYKEGIKKYVMKDTIKFWKTGIGNAIELKNYLFEKNEYCVKNGLYPHITLSTEGITDKSERYDRDFLVKNEDKKYKITHLNQLCYNPANLKFGVICINKYGNGIFSPIYSTFDINNIVIDYLELIITSNDFINYSMKYQQGTVFERMAVSSDDLCKIKIVTTSFDEQQKIAKVADTLNKKISKLEDELMNLKHLKSTLLNDMFI